MNRHDDIKVSKPMVWGAMFFCFFAFAPHILLVYYNNAFFKVITVGAGFYAYLLFEGFIVTLIVGLFDPRMGQKRSELDQ